MEEVLKNSTVLFYIFFSGIAKLGSICTDSAYAVVEAHGGMEAAAVFAHELGHMYGGK